MIGKADMTVMRTVGIGSLVYGYFHKAALQASWHADYFVSGAAVDYGGLTESWGIEY